MKTIKSAFCMLVFCILLGCFGCSQKRAKGLPEINLQQEYPQKTISLQEIADIEYIPMETKADVLIDMGGFSCKTVISDSLIITLGYNGSVFVFYRQGKSLYAFNHIGRAPDEYSRIQDMMVDFAEQEIYLVDALAAKNILIYALDGSFKRKLSLPAEYSIFQLFNYDRNSILCYDGYGVELELNKHEILNYQPYMLISKKDGTIIPLDLVLPGRFNLCWRPDDKFGMVFNLGAYPIIKNGTEFLISDFGQDTVFRLKESVLTPFLSKTPPALWKSEIPELARVVLSIDKFTVFEYMDLRFLKNPSAGRSITNFLYDHLSGEIYRSVFVNDDYKGRKVVKLENSKAALPANYTYTALSASNLLQAYEEGHLKGKLKEIASHLDEDANPVLMLIKFKE